MRTFWLYTFLLPSPKEYTHTQTCAYTHNPDFTFPALSPIRVFPYQYAVRFIYFMFITYYPFFCKFYDNMIFVFTCYVSNIVRDPRTLPCGMMLNICYTNKCSVQWLMRILTGQNPNTNHTSIVYFLTCQKASINTSGKRKMVYVI